MLLVLKRKAAFCFCGNTVYKLAKISNCGPAVVQSDAKCIDYRG